MPRYHFQFHDGQAHPDPDGIELPGIEAARTHAVRYFGDLLRTEAGAFGPADEWRMEVSDESGLLLFTLHFLGMNAPALDIIQVPPAST